jgi:copper chaperone
MLRFVANTPSPYQEFRMSQTRDYTVQGMTCSHCVLSVREEVSEVSGVSAVDVDLATGRMTVTGQDISDEAVRAAVAEAGYELA